MKQLVTLTVLIFACANLVAQNTFKPDSIKRSINATYSKEPFKLDGKLTELVWRTTSVASSFTQVEPYQERKANDSTEVRVTYDSRFVYIAAFCRDTLGRKSFKAPD